MRGTRNGRQNQPIHIARHWIVRSVVTPLPFVVAVKRRGGATNQSMTVSRPFCHEYTAMDHRQEPHVTVGFLAVVKRQFQLPIK